MKIDMSSGSVWQNVLWFSFCLLMVSGGFAHGVLRQGVMAIAAITGVTVTAMALTCRYRNA